MASVSFGGGTYLFLPFLQYPYPSLHLGGFTLRLAIHDATCYLFSDHI